MGTPTIGTSAPTGFNLPAGCDTDENGAMYITAPGQQFLHKVNESGAQLAVLATGVAGYGLAVDRTLQRVYQTCDSPGVPHVRWYAYDITFGVQGQFNIPIVAPAVAAMRCRGATVLANGNLLLFEDEGAPPSGSRIIEVTNTGTHVLTWWAPSAQSKRFTHGWPIDGVVYAGIAGGYSAIDRGIRKFNAVTGADLGNFFPGQYAPGRGQPNTPWVGGTVYISEYTPKVVGKVDGKLILALNSFDTGHGIYEMDPATGAIERLLVAQTGDAGGWPMYYAGYLFGGAVGPNTVDLTTYNTHSAHRFWHRTATAQWDDVAQQIGVGTFGIGARLRRALAKGWDQKKGKIQYRIELGPWTDVTPQGDVLGSGAGVDIAGKRLDVLLQLNTWRGFESVAPLDKAAPTMLPGVEIEDGQVLSTIATNSHAGSLSAPSFAGGWEA